MPTSIASSLIGSPISFVVFAPNILTSSFTNVKLLSILDASDALKITNVAQMHAIIFPTIPTQFQPANDFTTYPYLKLMMQNGQIAVIGLPWINGDITQSSYSTARFDVSGVTADQLQVILELLISNGFTEVAASMLPSN